jgi:membrane associated rhomboid family serine protease
MIPVGDSVRSRSFPWVNVAIIVINIVVFLYEVSLSQQNVTFNVTELDRFIDHWANIPACTFDVLGVDANLDNARALRLCAGQPRPLLTPVTSMFMHGGFAHIFGNMLFLWIFGDNVEDALGHLRYGVFYLLCGVIASFAQGVIDIASTTPSLGASGAVAGVMGAYIVLFPRATVHVIIGFILIPMPLPAFVLIGVWFLMQLFSGAASLGVDTTAGGGIAYFAHIGGFLAGAALINVFALGRPRRLPHRERFTDLW